MPVTCPLRPAVAPFVQRPIVLVSNAAALPPALAGARLRVLPFQRPALSAAAHMLAGVCAAEGAPLEPAALKALVLRCRCDLRCAGPRDWPTAPCLVPKSAIPRKSVSYVVRVQSNPTAL